MVVEEEEGGGGEEGRGAVQVGIRGHVIRVTDCAGEALVGWKIAAYGGRIASTGTGHYAGEEGAGRRLITLG